MWIEKVQRLLSRTNAHHHLRITTFLFLKMSVLCQDSSSGFLPLLRIVFYLILTKGAKVVFNVHGTSSHFHVLVSQVTVNSGEVLVRMSEIHKPDTSVKAN